MHSRTQVGADDCGDSEEELLEKALQSPKLEALQQYLQEYGKDHQIADVSAGFHKGMRPLYCILAKLIIEPSMCLKHSTALLGRHDCQSLACSAANEGGILISGSGLR